MPTEAGQSRIAGGLCGLPVCLMVLSAASVAHADCPVRFTGKLLESPEHGAFTPIGVGGVVAMNLAHEILAQDGRPLFTSDRNVEFFVRVIDPNTRLDGEARASMNLSISDTSCTLTLKASTFQVDPPSGGFFVAAIGFSAVALQTELPPHMSAIRVFGTLKTRRINFEGVEQPEVVEVINTVSGPVVRIPDRTCRAATIGGFSTDVREMTIIIQLNIEPLPHQMPDTFIWDNLSGGSYENPANWEPDCGGPPRHDGQRSDTAIFGGLSSGPPVAITATNATAGRWRINDMTVDLKGSASVLGGTGAATDFVLEISGEGALILDGGASLVTRGAFLGARDGEEARVFLSGAGTRWETGPLLMGGAAPAAVTVEDGALLVTPDTINLGSVRQGKLKVRSGARVQALRLEMPADNGPGIIEVRGVGAEPSTLLLTGELKLAGTAVGPASMLVEDGALVQAPTVLIGDSGHEKVTITGVHANGRRSALRATGQGESLLLKGAVVPEIEIRDGGTLSTTGARIGDQLGSGRILVHNLDAALAPFDQVTGTGGAAWTASGDITLGGGSQPAELVVEDNGVVICKDLVVGAPTGAGRVKVASGGSIIASNVAVGSTGSGRLFIDPGGILACSRGSVGGSVAGGDGEVVIRAGLATDAEWILAGDLTVGGASKGVITLLTQSIIGPIAFAEARLTVSGQLTVDTNGFVMGNGTLAVPENRRVINGGSISPGLSAGQITVDGDYEQTEGGVLIIEVAGLEPGQFDVLHVTGNALLAGTVDLRFIDGFVPQPGDSVDFVVVDGTITGKLTGSRFIEAPGDPESGQPGAQAEVKWEVTPEGTCRLTVTNVSALEDAARRLPSECGAGLCGAGVLPMLPLTYLGLVALRRFSRPGRAIVQGNI